MKATRELWLILRARDEASNTLRRAARSFGGLQDPGVLQRQRAQVMQQIATAERLRKAALDEQTRLTTGSRRTQQLINEGNYTKRIHDLNMQLVGIDSDRDRILSRRYSLQRQLSQLERVAERRARVKGIQPEMIFSGMTQKELDTQLRSLRSGVKSATRELTENKMAIESVRKAQGNLVNQSTKLTQTEIEQAAAARRNGMVADEQGMRITNMRARVKEFDTAIQRLPIENWQALGNGIRNTARSLTFLGGVATLTLGVMAEKAAEFSKQIALAATQARQPGEGPARVAQIHGRLFDTITSQMQEFPASSQQMADSLFQIFSSTSIKNIDVASKMLRTFNMMAVAGGTDLKTMTDAGISLFNNFGSEFPNMTEAGNRFFAAVKVGRMNAEQFASSLSFLLPIAKEAGLTFEDVGGAMAFLTRQTGAARTKQDAQGLARLIQLFGRTDVAAGLASKGVQVFGQGGKGHMRPILDIMQDINSHIHMNNQEMLNFFKTISAAGGKAGTQGTIQAIRIFAQYQVSIRSAAQVQREFTADQNEMIASFNQMSKDPGVRWEVFKNQLRALALIIGTDLIPLFARFGSWIGKLARWFSGLSQYQKRLIADFLFFGSVATLLIGILGSIAAAVILLRVNFILMKGSLTSAGLSLKMFRSEAGFTAVGLTKLLGSISLLLVALPLLVKLTGSWGAALSIVGTVISVISFVTLFAMIARSVTALRSLAALASVPYLITFTLVVVGAELIAHQIEKLQKSYLDAEARVVDLTTQPQQRFIDYLGKEINKLKKAGETSAQILKDLDTKLGGGPQAKDLEAAAFVRASELRKPRAQRLEEAMAGTARKGPGMIPIHFTDAEFLKEMKLIIRLRQAIEKAPNYKAVIAATKAARREETRAARAESDIQKGMQEDVIQRILDGQINALISTKGYAKKISEEYFKVQKQFAIAPTIGLSNKIEALKTKFEQLTPAQQAFYTQMFADLGISDKLAMSTFMHLRQLQAQMKIAPTMNLANQIEKATKIMQQASPAQQAYFQQLEQNLGDVKVISDAQAMAMGQNVARLRAAYDKSPSVAGWQRWYAANKQFTTLATSDQQEFANDMAQANKEATDKMKENFQSVLDNIRSMFDEIRGGMVSAFGSLASGPVTKGLSDQVQKIRDAGTAKAQALRDQAQKIQDAFDQSSKEVDARTGNLIDKGWLPNPDDMKKDVDARVKILNDQADRIDKAAGKRADALQKRLDEHRLTPSEILNDLKKQVQAFTHWSNDLNKIAARGAPQALIDQLRELGPEFDNVLKGILRMSPAQFAEYTRTFNKGQQVIDQQTMKLLQDKLHSQLKVYRAHGQNIAKAIAQGIQDQNPALRAALIQLIEQTFPGIKVPGGVGVKQPTTRTGAATRGVRAATTPTRTTQNVHHTTVNYNYHAGDGKGMSPQTYFQKMHFRQRNQRRC